jgi:hypothetical protein
LNADSPSAIPKEPFMNDRLPTAESILLAEKAKLEKDLAEYECLLISVQKKNEERKAQIKAIHDFLNKPAHLRVAQ